MAFPWKEILKIGLTIGTQVAGALIPGAGAVVALIPQVIAAVEAAISGSGAGAQKKTAAMEAVMTALAIAEGITRKDLIDNGAAMDAIDHLIDDAVALENAIHWKKGK